MSRKAIVGLRGAVAAALLVCLGTGTARAQTVVDATTAEFQPSIDHNVTATDGTPRLLYYVLQFFPVGSSTPSHSIDVGKPAADADGMLRFQFTAHLTTPLVAGTTYQARVTAVGPGGTGVSALSNPFTTSSPCAPSLSPTTAGIAAAATSGSVSIAAGASCPWTAGSNATWLTVTSAAAGTGPATVRYSATANTATAARTGTLTIAGRTFTVTQSGATPCTYAITPTSRTSPAAGENITVNVTTTSSCAWTSTETSTWLALGVPTATSGNGSVTVTVAANATPSQRTATVTIAGRTFTVTQQGGPCTYTATPATIAAPAIGASGSVSVATTAGCVWTASGVPAWITTGTASQTGAGSLAYTVAPNSGPARSVTLMIGGKPVVVNQVAAPAPPPPANFRVVGS